MSLYNLLFGKSPQTEIALTVAGLRDKELGRFRDAYLIKKDNQIMVAVYTRNGGGNRECWNDKCNIEHQTCPGCVITYADRLFPNFITDEDDDFDCTYATMYFSILDEFKDEVQKLVNEHPEFFEHESLSDRFSKIMDAMSNQI